MVLTQLRLIKSASPGTGCSVLTDDLRRLGVASSDGTDDVVLQGTLPTEHFETIARLLDRHEDLGPQQQMANVRISSAVGLQCSTKGLIANRKMSSLGVLRQSPLGSLANGPGSAV